MIDTTDVRKKMLHDEYEEACAIREQCRVEGLSVNMTVAVAYKAGQMAGKARGNARAKEAYRLLHEAKEKARQSYNESEIEWINDYNQSTPAEQLEFLSEVRKNLDREEARVRAQMNSPTLGVEMEDNEDG